MTSEGFRQHIQRRLPTATIEGEWPTELNFIGDWDCEVMLDGERFCLWYDMEPAKREFYVVQTCGNSWPITEKTDGIKRILNEVAAIKKATGE